MAVIGIDLGTTNSCAASVRLGEPRVIANSEGDRVTPSVVAFGSEGQRLIGQPAKRQALVNPSNTIYSVKRFIGREFNSPPVQSMLPDVPYRVVNSPRGDVRIDVRGQSLSPEELSSMILARIRNEAESTLEENVKEAVITVPAYFDERQRAATRDAGRIAGLDIMRIINEPTAAALAYGFQHRSDGVIAVYDLGGGTFDISILRQSGSDFEVLATSGDTFLGGDDFDRVLMDWVIDSFRAQTGETLPSGDATVLQRLRNAVEEAKRELSFREATRISIPFIGGGPAGALHLDLELTRQEFEDLVTPLVERSLAPCEQALNDAGLDPQAIGGVILVGGQTRTPVVQRRVEEFFGRSPVRGINPDEAVALGAAITASMNIGEIEEVKLRDVIPLSIGLETAGGAFTRVIPRNTPLPARAAKVFTTTQANQSVIRVRVMQGERDMARENRALGTFDLVGIRPAPRGAPTIGISFDVDESGIVHVTATDQDTGLAQDIRIEDATGLTDAEIEAMLAKAAAQTERDVGRKEWLEVKNEALRLAHMASAMVKDPLSAIPSDSRDTIRSTARELESALDRDDPARVSALRHMLADLLSASGATLPD